ncbi:MAG: cytochrome c [Planctomycetota bacterium]
MRLTALGGLLFSLGCGSSEPPAFRLNMVAMTSGEVTVAEDYQQEIANVLDGVFGTPDHPRVISETGLDQSLLDMAAGPAWSDDAGANYGLYRKHCVHCHGISGDGRGPTARFLNPYPRDYRPAVFKFKSTVNAAQPTDDDLHRVLINGVPGTSMPSFALLPSGEVESLVEYVKYLSMRGQLETALTNFTNDELGVDDGERFALDPLNDPEQGEIIKEMLAEIVEGWDAAGDQVIAPAEETAPLDDRSPQEIAQSVEAGRKLFYGKQANCYTCHGPTGLGDGQQDDYHVWNKANKLFMDEIANEELRIQEGWEGDDLTKEDKDDLRAREEALVARREVASTLYPVRNAIPRNLRQGVYRGGRRPIDVFRKIHTGIAGSPMPGIGTTLSEEQLWNIVDYVLSLPYEAASQPQRALAENIAEIN